MTRTPLPCGARQTPPTARQQRSHPAMETFPLFASSPLPKTKHAAQVGEHLPTSSGKTREFVQIPGYLEAAFLKEDNRGSSEQQLSVLRRLGWRPRESAIPAHHTLTALPTAVTLRRVCYKTSTEIILFSCRNARIETQGKSSKTGAAGFVEAKPALLTEQGPPHGGNLARNHLSAGMLAKKLL